MSEQRTVTLPPEPCVVLSDGFVVTVLTDRATGLTETGGLTGIGLAVMVARLRAIADELEGSRHDGFGL